MKTYITGKKLLDFPLQPVYGATTMTDNNSSGFKNLHIRIPAHIKDEMVALANQYGRSQTDLVLDSYELAKHDLPDRWGHDALMGRLV